MPGVAQSQLFANSADNNNINKLRNTSCSQIPWPGYKGSTSIPMMTGSGTTRHGYELVRSEMGTRLLKWMILATIPTVSKAPGTSEEDQGGNSKPPSMRNTKYRKRYRGAGTDKSVKMSGDGTGVSCTSSMIIRS